MTDIDPFQARICFIASTKELFARTRTCIEGYKKRQGQSFSVEGSKKHIYRDVFRLWQKGSQGAGIILTRNRMENKSLQWLNKRLKGGYTTVGQVVTCAHSRMSLWKFDHSKGRLKFRLRMEKLFRLLELGRFQSDWWTWFYLYRSRALHSGIRL